MVTEAKTRRPLRWGAAVFVCLSLTILSFAACFGQTPAAQAPGQSPLPPPVTISLTLKDAVKIALKQNPQVVVARLLSLESDRGRQIARAALLPQANLTAAGAVGQYNLASVERTTTRGTAGPYQFIQAGPAFSQTILNLPLFRNYQIASEGTRE